MHLSYTNQSVKRFIFKTIDYNIKAKVFSKHHQYINHRCPLMQLQSTTSSRQQHGFCFNLMNEMLLRESIMLNNLIRMNKFIDISKVKIIQFNISHNYLNKLLEIISCT